MLNLVLSTIRLLSLHDSRFCDQIAQKIVSMQQYGNKDYQKSSKKCKLKKQKLKDVKMKDEQQKQEEESLSLPPLSDITQIKENEHTTDLMLLQQIDKKEAESETTSKSKRIFKTRILIKKIKSPLRSKSTMIDPE